MIILAFVLQKLREKVQSREEVAVFEQYYEPDMGAGYYYTVSVFQLFIYQKTW